MINANTAYAIVGEQERAFRKIKNFILTNGAYDFRLSYRGGFSCYIAIDYREANTRKKWRYFGGVGAYNCMTVRDAVNLCICEINKKSENKIEKFS